MLIIIYMLITIVLIVVNVQGTLSLDGPIVETKLGLIRGVRATDGDYYKFLGIPYATVDKENPFAPPTTHPRFDEIFEADDDSAECPQLHQVLFTPIGTLDCLHLNIYVPVSTTSRSHLPVLVWIHGGAFVMGSGNRYLYGPKFIVRHDVILVTVNYRLGPYGFMCLNIPEVPGNQGLKDQVIALRWIKDNIESFGGDINRITLFGESAGAMSVDFHLYSKEEKLFNNVIIQSGTALQSNLVVHPNNAAALDLAERLGYVTTDVKEAINFLSTMDTDWVIGAAAFSEHSFFSCVENEFENVENFMSVHPINQKVPKAEGIQILIGYTNDEMLVFYANAAAEAFTVDDIKNGLWLLFDFDDKLNELESIVRHFYIGGEEISRDKKFEIADFASDVTFVHPTERSLNKYIDNGADNIYYYVFSYVGGRNYYRILNNVTVGGAVHADELGYLFDMELFPEDPSPEDQLVIDRMTSMWTNFAKYGDPTPNTSDLLHVKWEPITNGSPRYYLNIDSELSLGRRPFHHRMSFWDLFYKYNWQFQRGYVPSDG